MCVCVWRQRRNVCGEREREREREKECVCAVGQWGGSEEDPRKKESKIKPKREVRPSSEHSGEAFGWTAVWGRLNEAKEAGWI